jgi:hypothetical protein
VHNDNEEAAAERFQAEVARDLARCIIVRQKGHNETVSNAIGLFRKQFGVLRNLGDLNFCLVALLLRGP